MVWPILALCQVRFWIKSRKNRLNLRGTLHEKKVCWLSENETFGFWHCEVFLPRVAPFGSQPEPLRQGQALRLLHFVSQPGQAHLNVLNLKVPRARERLPLAPGSRTFSILNIKLSLIYIVSFFHFPHFLLFWLNGISPLLTLIPQIYRPSSFSNSRTYFFLTFYLFATVIIHYHFLLL